MERRIGVGLFVSQAALASQIAEQSLRLFSFVQLECGGVHAVTQTGRSRAVFKHVTKVRVAATADHGNPAHSETAIVETGNVLLSNRLPEAGPAGAGLELRFRIEQWSVAADAAIDAFAVLVPVLAGKSALRAVVARNFEGLWRKLLPPFAF